MPDEPTNPTTDEPTTDEPSPEPDPTEEPPVEDPDAPSDEPTEEEPDGLDLDGAKKALANVRKSEAKMRTRLRDIESKLEEAKTPEQVEALLSEVRADSHALVVENVALKHGLPADLAAALKGDTRDELEAHAKVLAKYAPRAEPSDDPDLSGGLDPSGDKGPAFDPVKAARAARSRRY